jgi:hypothetical protein
LKNAADYGQGHTVTVPEAERAIDEASRLIEIVDTIMGPLMGE